MPHIHTAIGKLIKYANIQGYFPARQSTQTFDTGVQDAKIYEQKVDDIPNESFQNPGMPMSTAGVKDPSPIYRKFKPQSSNSSRTKAPGSNYS